MKDIRINILAGCLIGIVLFSACSVTKHLPEDEILYTGGKTVIVNQCGACQNSQYYSVGRFSAYSF